MAYVKLSNGLVTAVTNDPNDLLAPSDAAVGWVFDGVTFWSSAQALELATATAIQRYLDGVAIRTGYDNAWSCVSYWNSRSEKRATHAQLFSAHRDDVWDTVEAYEWDVLAGVRAPIPPEHLLDELPKAPW